MGEEQQGASGSGCAGKLVVGCLFVSLLAVVGCIAGYYYVASYARQAAGDLMVTMADEYMKNLRLPENSREEVMVPIRKLGKRIADGEIGASQVAKMSSTFLKGPIPNMLMAKGFEANCLEKAKLTEPEKAKAKKDLSRLVHGLTEKKIPYDKVKPVFEPLTETVQKKEGNVTKTTVRFKENPSDEDMKKSIQRLQELVDAAGIPDQSFTFDLSSEVARILNEGLEAK